MTFHWQLTFTKNSSPQCLRLVRRRDIQHKHVTKRNLSHQGATFSSKSQVTLNTEYSLGQDQRKSWRPEEQVHHHIIIFKIRLKSSLLLGSRKSGGNLRPVGRTHTFSTIINDSVFCPTTHLMKTALLNWKDAMNWPLSIEAVWFGHQPKLPIHSDHSQSPVVAVTLHWSPGGAACHPAAPEATTDANCQLRAQQEEQTSVFVLHHGSERSKIRWADRQGGHRTVQVLA